MTEALATKTLLELGITKVYRGFLPLVDLIQMAGDTSQLFDRHSVQAVAEKHGVLVSTMSGRIRKIASRMEESAPEVYGRVMNGPYTLIGFVEGLALEAVRETI